MRSLQIAYREPHLILTACEFGACLNDSGICGSYEGIDASGNVVLCSLDCSEAA